MEKIFDTFEFDGAWFGEMKLNFAGKDYEIEIQIDGYDEDEMPEDGKAALVSFVENMDEALPAIKDSLFEYYHERKKEYGYDENDEEYPDYETFEQVLETLELLQITVPDQEDYSERAIGLVFDCGWDEEEGVGICLLGNEVDEIGIQGIAL